MSPISDITSGLTGLGTGMAQARVEGDQLARAAERTRGLERAAEDGRVDEAVRGFEQVFATMLAAEMRRGLDEGFFGSGPGSDSFSGWLDEHIGEQLAERGTFGLDRLLEGLRAHRIQGETA